MIKRRKDGNVTIDIYCPTCGQYLTTEILEKGDISTESIEDCHGRHKVRISVIREPSGELSIDVFISEEIEDE